MGKSKTILALNSFMILVASFASVSYAQIHQVSDTEPAGRTMLLIADNQEHNLTGVPLRSLSPLTERYVTSVAMRSPLANVGGRLLMQEFIRFGRQQGAEIVLHLGDLANISCPDEFDRTLSALDAEMPHAWFIVPGNHDGFLAGNFSGYQPSLCFDVGSHCSPYTEAPNEPMPAERGWLNACLSPANLRDRGRANILTKEDAIKRYMNWLRRRPHAVHSLLGTERVTIENTVVTCDLEKIEIPSDQYSYSAIARVCPRTRVGTGTTWVGPYASYMVQRLDFASTRFLLLDTSVYENPTLRNVALRGSLSAGRWQHPSCSDQLQRAEQLFQAPRTQEIVNEVAVGHHPLQDFNRRDRSWISQHTSRYISAHTHHSTTWLNHEISTRRVNRRVTELNIGSTLDYPPQAVVVKLNRSAFYFRVAGADTNWAEFKERCESRENWRLTPQIYEDYRSGSYVSHLIRALRSAADAPGAPGLARNVPTGRVSSDWAELERLLNDIRAADGDAGLFWACQAYYASEATQRERGHIDRIMSMLGRGFKPGRRATDGWFRFDP